VSDTVFVSFVGDPEVKELGDNGEQALRGTRRPGATTGKRSAGKLIREHNKVRLGPDSE